MKIYIENLKYEYELKMLYNSFSRKDVNFYHISEYNKSDNDNYKDNYIAIHEESESGPGLTKVSVISNIDNNNYNYTQVCPDINKEVKNAYKRCLYRVLSSALDRNLPWGILTGIRPVKIYNELRKNASVLSDLTEDCIKNEISSKYLISDKKIELMKTISYVQKLVIDALNDESYSIYIGIPFCPSRCNYCSFFSNDTNQKGHLRDPYIDALEKEIDSVTKEEWIQGKRLDSIYVGGGTPTALKDCQIEKLMIFLNSKFDFSKIKEITYEAGRPDTITESNLKILKKYGVNRISINPQTMVDETLKKIGRLHNSEAIEHVFNLAREIGFDNINMDIILGLQDEDVSSVRHTLSRIIDLNPDSITMHTLSIKKASTLHQNIDYEELERQEHNIHQMVEVVYECMNNMNFIPYYLYRQKNILGGFENVGFSKPGKESWYNIVIMEELQNILAFGSGSVSRFVYTQENRIEKVANIKNLEEYINRTQDMVNRKRLEMN